MLQGTYVFKNELGETVQIHPKALVNACDLNKTRKILQREKLL